MPSESSSLSSSPPAAEIGTLAVFWTLIEPILTALHPRRLCEVGVDAGALTARLLAWADEHGGDYVGIDPAPAPAVGEWFVSGAGKAGRQLLLQTSLAALPALGRCDAYFIDGDHNYYTVHGELTLIAQAARNGDPQARGPVVFAHDVGWPWGHRDMYYLPTTVPTEARQPWSESLGAMLDSPELIDGGLREPGRYAIALQPGGPRNGVLTAVEDFLASEPGTGWESIILPVAYGLAVLYRPADPALPPSCRARLEDLRKMSATGEEFLQTCEDSYLRLYLYGEYSHHMATIHADTLLRESTAHRATLGAYADLERAYGDLLAHSHALETDYQRLLGLYERLREQSVAPSPP